jgi:hypothetical protein
LGGIAANEYALKTDIVNQEGAVSREELEAALEGFATAESLNDYATKDYVEVELTEYATNAALNTALADCVSKEYVDNALSNLPTGDLDAHIADTNNPHKVSAQQIGAAAAADLEALAADVGTVAADIETHKNAENPHNITAAMIGAAKAGYGYGEQVISMGAIFADEAAFNTALDNMLSTMNNDETKQVSFKITAVESIAIGDWIWRGTLYKASANYAILSADSSFAKQTRISKVKYNGAWQPWEWENPPMIMDTEYRTTERYNGKPVYVKLINAGNSEDGKTISYGVTRDRIIDVKVTMVSAPIIQRAAGESATSSDYYASFYATSNNVTLLCKPSMVGSPCYVFIKYVK